MLIVSLKSKVQVFNYGISMILKVESLEAQDLASQSATELPSLLPY